MVTKKDPFSGNGRALIIGEPEGLVKVIAEKLPDGSAGRILGVHMVGPGSQSSWAKGTWLSTGRPRPKKWPISYNLTHHCQRYSARQFSPWPEEVFTLADITMPQLGETVTEGTITKWHKQVGDAVAEDEVLFEVSTDKVDSEVPSPVSGTVTDILVQEGDTVSVGTKLAVIGRPERCHPRPMAALWRRLARRARAMRPAPPGSDGSPGNGKPAPDEVEVPAGGVADEEAGTTEADTVETGVGGRRPGGQSAQAPAKPPTGGLRGPGPVPLTSVLQAGRPRVGRASSCRRWYAG